MQCDNQLQCDYWRYMLVGHDSTLDVLPCLSMNHPDDVGYATVNECLLKSGSTVTNVGGCTGSPVYVTGRTSTPD
jgi:hypothetical protein